MKPLASRRLVKLVAMARDYFSSCHKLQGEKRMRVARVIHGIREGIAFDDVLLVPRLTGVKSRKDVNLTTTITSGVRLNIPIVSANVPWCTGWRMAATMALLGGVGVIHRMTTVRLQVNEVIKAKKVGVSTAEYPSAVVGDDGRLIVGAAIGVKGDFVERAKRVLDVGANFLVLDIAHGHSVMMLRAIEVIKKAHPRIPLVAGNVATRDGARDLTNAGADAVKVGIGPGGICTTRIVTGCGVPQLTAVANCAEYAKTHNIPIIADGGLRSSGDVTKALAAGASAVMLGSKLAGADESAARLVHRGGRKVKITTGFVTLGMELTIKRAERGYVDENELDSYVPEGVEATFPYSGSLKATLTPLLGGLRSGMSYCGATRIPELWRVAQFMRITPAAALEGRPHSRDNVAQVHPDYLQKFSVEARRNGNVSRPAVSDA